MSTSTEPEKAQLKELIREILKSPDIRERMKSKEK
jgi:hypothetical protein